MLQTITLPQQGIREFPIGVDKITLTNGFYEHYHDYVEINVIVRGTALHIVNGRPQPIRTGDAFVLNPGTSHGFTATDNLVLYQAMFAPELIQACLPVLKKMSGYHALFILEPAALSAAQPFKCFTFLEMKDLEAVVMLFESMLEESLGKREGYQAMLLSYVVRLVTALSRHYSGGRQENPGVIRRVASAAAFVEEHYLSPISLAQLAAVANSSVSQLIRDFKRSYGTTPGGYITHMRIEHAIHLLKNKRMSVTEVAYECCFSDSNYFARAFKKHTGMSPSQYRLRT